MKVATIFGLFVCVAVCNSFVLRPAAQCDEGKFAQCSADFMTQMGLPETETMMQFVWAVNDLLQTQGKDGFGKLCKAVTAFQTCNGDQLDTCESVQNLESLGLSKAEAIGFVEIYKNFEFTCGPGKEVMESNFDCIMKTNKTEYDTLTKCGIEFGKAIKKHPEQACALGQKLVICLSTPFGSNCGAEVGKTICEQQVNTISVALPQCKMQCPDMQWLID